MKIKQRILITGANGYLGKSLYNAFKDKYDVTAITRKEVDLTDKYDVDYFFSEREKFDVVLHCAIQGGSRLKQDDKNTLQNNLLMYYNLFNNRSFKKFINFGSGAELYNLDTQYGLSKKIIRESILNEENFYNIRIFGLFDENELDTRFIKSNIQRYIDRESILIYENKYMDFFYMKDLIKLVDFYISNKNNVLEKEIDCSYFPNYTLYSIAQMINDLDQYQVFIKRQYDISKYDKDYLGRYKDIGLEYIGLWGGIKEVYQKLKNEK